MVTKRTISIEVDLAALATHSDAHLATLWHLAQANPADGFTSPEPGDLAEQIGREIIRRWLRSVDPELWHHQGRHYHWHQLTRLGHWHDGNFTPTVNGSCPHPTAPSIAARRPQPARSRQVRGDAAPQPQRRPP